MFTESYVFFHDADGVLREIPAVWTDFVAGDPFVEVAAGRSALHAGSLVELAELVARMARELPQECQENDAADVMRITPSALGSEEALWRLIEFV